MPPTGRPRSMPANWVTAIDASRRSSSRSMRISASMSICASSSRVRFPPPPPDPASPDIPSRSSSSRSKPSPSSSTPGLYSEKYTSKTVSNAFQWWWCFTSVAPSAALNTSRSAMSTCSTARIASRFSVIETGKPADRSSWTKPWRRSSTGVLAAYFGDVPLSTSSLRAFAMSDWYFSSTWSVSPMTAGSICDLPR